MTTNLLPIIQRTLITIVALVLALVVVLSFLRLLQPPSPEALDRMANASTTTTSLAGPNNAGTTPDVTDAPAVTPTQPPVTVPGPLPTCTPTVPAPGSARILRLHFTCGDRVRPTPDSYVQRGVPRDDLPLTTTLELLVAGPIEAEIDAGFTSVFSEATADTFTGVSIDAGTAAIDFSDLEDSLEIDVEEEADFLLAELNGTVFQFDTINAIEYRLDGSCEEFYAMLGRSCTAISRSDWNAQAQTYREG